MPEPTLHAPSEVGVPAVMAIGHVFQGAWGEGGGEGGGGGGGGVGGGGAGGGGVGGGGGGGNEGDNAVACAGQLPPCCAPGNPSGM